MINVFVKYVRHTAFFYLVQVMSNKSEGLIICLLLKGVNGYSAVQNKLLPLIF